MSGHVDKLDRTLVSCWIWPTLKSYSQAQQQEDCRVRHAATLWKGASEQVRDLGCEELMKTGRASFALCVVIPEFIAITCFLQLDPHLHFIRLSRAQAILSQEPHLSNWFCTFVSLPRDQGYRATQRSRGRVEQFWRGPNQKARTKHKFFRPTF